MDEKKNIGSLFDRIAGRYDKFNHVMSMNFDKSWRKKAIKALKPVGDLLDVAIGTGDLTIEILNRGKAQRVVGLDLSREMMKVGEQKMAELGYSDRVRFDYGSALEMPYDNEEFDAVTCAYGVRNFSDLDKGLREMYRVLRPGGQLVILEFSYPGNPLIRWVYDFLFTHLMPIVGRLISKDPTAYVYFSKSVKDFIWGEEMKQHILEAGFAQAEYKTLTLGVTTIYSARK